MWVAEWTLATVDREEGQKELSQFLLESGWGREGADQLGWYSGLACSGPMLHPHQLSSQALLDAFQKAEGRRFHITLCQGPGNRWSSGSAGTSRSVWQQGTARRSFGGCKTAFGKGCYSIWES